MALTYTDRNEKIVVRAEGRFQAVVNAAVKAGDLLSFLNTSATNAMQLADQSDSKPAKAIAIENGASGDTVWCAETVELKAPTTIGVGGVVTQTNYAASSDYLGSSLYLGESGKPSSAVGSTHGQAVGYVLSRSRILLTVDPTLGNGNLYISDDFGVVVGHTSQLTISTGDGDTDLVPELQVLGTGQVDSSMLLAAFSTTATRAAAPTIALAKGGASTITVGTAVTDDEILGSIIAYGDDGTDLEAPAAAIEFAVDGAPGTGDMPGRIVFYTTVDAGEVLTERMRIDATGALFLNDTSHTSMTVGMTINMGANTDKIIALKTTTGSFNTGLTSIVGGDDVETDDFFVIQKTHGNLGGVHMQIFAEDGALTNPFNIEVVGGTANTAKTTSGHGLMRIEVYEHDGANALADITADGNVFSVSARVGGSILTRFLVDEDGDMYTVTTGQTFDHLDDASLALAYDNIRSGVHRVWEGFVDYFENTLIEAGILGAPLSEGGMTNVTQLQRFHNGAIIQAKREREEIRAEIVTLQRSLLALEAN
jgi:hypothetical protein